MRTVAIISQKGGAGKTTLAVHLAVAASAAGLRVAVVDTDPQGNAAGWGDSRQAATPEVVSGFASRLPKLLEAAHANNADLVLIDTAPKNEDDAEAAAQVADLILIPSRAAAFDIAAIRRTLALAARVARPAFVILNAVPPRSGIGREAAEGLEKIGARVAPASLTYRAAFYHAVNDGRVAQEFEPAGKAAEEVAAVFAWLSATVGLPRRRVTRAA